MKDVDELSGRELDAAVADACEYHKRDSETPPFSSDPGLALWVLSVVFFRKLRGVLLVWEPGWHLAGITGEEQSHAAGWVCTNHSLGRSAGAETLPLEGWPRDAPFVHERGDTAPEAICRAALKAVRANK